MRLALHVLPLDDADRQALAGLATDLAAHGYTVTLLAPRALPADGYDAHRRQYRAEVLLSLARGVDAPGLVLAVTQADLYAEGLNFVFGIADSPGRAAVVSLHRLAAGPGETRFRARAVKEAVHEIGHVLGLGHCPDPTCVMFFSNSLADTDRKNAGFCGACRARCAALAADRR